MIQGGAGGLIKDKRRRLKIRKKMAGILDRGYKKLLSANAIAAVTWVTRLLENDPEFNAGRGAMLQADGKARLSAAVMDGARSRFAGVINIEGIRNPVLVARSLLEESSRILAGPEARRWAVDAGFETGATRTARSIRLWEKKSSAGSDTVGAVALDAFGQLASATSTGGRGYECPGRVSDSPMPAATYATDYCAISATGHGEEIIEAALAVRIAQRAADMNSLKQAFRKTFSEVSARKGYMGAIGLNRLGHVVIQTTTPSLLYGWQQGKFRKLF